MDDLRIAAVCMHAEPGQIEQNMERIRSLTLHASAAGAKWVCLPELSVTGYILKDPRNAYGGRDWQEVMGPLTRLAQDTGVVLLAGLIEISPGAGPYISQVVVSDRGLQGTYRKTHLGPPERESYEAGEEIRVFFHGNTRFGLQLCYEAHFPEISTAMALMGAEVLFFPHASPRGKPPAKLEGWLRHLRARAFDNGVFVVACNQVGKVGGGLSFPGVAVVVSPEGRVMDSYTGESEKVLTVDIPGKLLREARAHRMKYFLPHRRPGLYGKIVEQ
jgi:N-carbamoylputrescine amidase